MDTYTEEQVEQLLHYALARRPDGQELSRQQVYEIASDLGVSQADFSAAEQEWLAKQGTRQELVTFDLYKKKKFKANLLKYTIINAFLVAINLSTSGHIGWAVYPLLFWGLGVVLDGWVTYQPDSEEYEKQFLKWGRKQKRDRIAAKITDKVTTSVEEWLKPSK